MFERSLALSKLIEARSSNMRKNYSLKNVYAGKRLGIRDGVGHVISKARCIKNYWRRSMPILLSNLRQSDCRRPACGQSVRNTHIVLEYLEKEIPCS